jgi:hypothetical protein
MENLCQDRPVLRACHRAERSCAVGSNHHAASTVELKKTAKQKSLRSLEGLNLPHRTNLVLEKITTAAATVIRITFQAPIPRSSNHPMKMVGAIGVCFVQPPTSHPLLLTHTTTCFGREKQGEHPRCRGWGRPFASH